jgi:hypothetical protein
MTLLLVITSYVLCVFYVKLKMKSESSDILEEIRKNVDSKNLDNLVKLSEKKLNPDSYNSSLFNYREAAAIYAGMRALKSPLETFTDFFRNFRSY